MPLRIDGREVQAAPEWTIWNAARSVGIEIPTLCFVAGARPFGGCRICLVEVEGQRELVPACSTRVAPGLSVRTASKRVQEARRFVLGLILEEHARDCGGCPIREACALRRLASDLGLRISPHEKGAPGDRDGAIIRIRERCILCGRCVRVCAEIQGACAISFRGRGARTDVGPPEGMSLRAAGCVQCRKCVEACPAGALVWAGRAKENGKTP